MLCSSPCHVFDLAITSWGKHGEQKTCTDRDRRFNELETRMMLDGYVRMLDERSERDRQNMRWRIEKYGRTLTLPRVVRPPFVVDECSVFWAQFKLQKSNFIDSSSSGAVAYFDLSFGPSFVLKFGGH